MTTNNESPFVAGLKQLDARLTAARSLAAGTEVQAKPDCDLEHRGTRGTLLYCDAAGVATVEVRNTRVGPTGLNQTIGTSRHQMPADQLVPFRLPTWEEQQAARKADDGEIPF